jgi:phosphohistidine phosphatase
MSAVIFLLRHGIAAGPSPHMSDAERALTADGARKTTRAARGLAHLGVAPEIVLSSPLRRAHETADLVAEILSPALTVEIYPPLAPGHGAEDVLRGLHAHRRARQILLVGHQPDLGLLASYLLTGTASLVPLPFKKAGTAAFRVDGIPPRVAATLEWFLTPRQLRAIGRDRR